MNATQPDPIRRPGTTRKLIAVAIALVLAAGVAVLVWSSQADDDEYTAEHLASWCSVARDRDFPAMLAQGFASPQGEAVEVAGTTIPAASARAMGNAMLRSILDDPPPEIAVDIEASVGVLLTTYEDGSAPDATGQRVAIDAAARSQDHIDRHC